jgi:hypothetical protein
MQAPIAALIAKDQIEDPRRFADEPAPERRQPAEDGRAVRRRFAAVLRRSADRLAPLPD